jgi:hypothetical protein
LLSFPPTQPLDRGRLANIYDVRLGGAKSSGEQRKPEQREK